MKIILVACAAMVVLTAAASAQPTNYNTRHTITVQQASNVARSGVQTVYGAVGRDMCGPTCGVVARSAGGVIYDQAQRFSVTNGARLQQYGQTLAKPYTCIGRGTVANSTPAICR